MPRQSHQCQGSSCSLAAKFHLTWAERRRCTREQHFCEQHAREVLEFPWTPPQPFQGVQGFLEGATCVDVELVVICELCDEQVIYLREVGGYRGVPMLTGWSEAWALALRLKGYTAPRPLTHDAMLRTVEVLGGAIQDVLVDTLENGAYHAKLRLVQSGSPRTVDTRPSDAINLVVAANRPIFFTSDLFESVFTRT